MPTVAEAPADLLCDTSVSVPLVVADHEHHAMVTEVLRDARLGLAGHAAFETYSVLTRLPPPARRTPAIVSQLLAANFPASTFLSSTGAASLLDRVAALGIAGGAVYDALVGAAASEAAVMLVTRDRRAVETYRALGVDFRLID